MASFAIFVTYLLMTEDAVEMLSPSVLLCLKAYTIIVKAQISSNKSKTSASV